VQGVQGVARCSHRRDLSQRVVGKLLGRAKHVNMRIAGSCWQSQTRSSRQRVIGSHRDCQSQTRSMISAMPWPTPMHMVHSA
jgi:hypothetical protein